MQRVQECFGVPTTRRNEVIFDTGNGAGSINTKIRNYTNVTIFGTAMAASTSATLGAEIRVREAGQYMFTIVDLNNGASAAIGISRNSTQLTTSAFTITSADKIVLSQTNGASVLGSVSVSTWCYAGDVIRHHGGGTVGNDTTVDSKFIAVKMPD